MCVTFLLVNDDAKSADEWQLILINNRDEDYSRPTARAQWKDGVLCGRDLFPGREGGTWLGVSKTGRLAVLMNIIPPIPPKNASALKSRGFLVQNFVQGDMSPEDYAKNLSKSSESYANFGIILLDKIFSRTETGTEKSNWRLAYYNNETNRDQIENLQPGIYAFGNSPRKNPILKVQYGLNLFQQICVKHLLNRNVDSFVDDLLKILTDKRECYPDDVLTKYQSDKNAEGVKLMSSCFVRFPPPHTYGTRTHTILLIDGEGQANYVEKNLENHQTGEWTTIKHVFELKKPQNQIYTNFL